MTEGLKISAGGWHMLHAHADTQTRTDPRHGLEGIMHVDVFLRKILEASCIYCTAVIKHLLGLCVCVCAHVCTTKGFQSINLIGCFYTMCR